MLQSLTPLTIKQVRLSNHPSKVIIQLLQQDEPHIVHKLLNRDIIEFYSFCEKLAVDAFKLGQYLYHLHLQRLNSPLSK